MRGKAVLRMLAGAAIGLALSAVTPAAAQTKLTIVTFAGATNLPVWRTRNRIAAMKENKAVAAVISPPEHMKLMKEGYNLLGDATEAIGAYQGSAFIVRRSWAKAHEKETLAFIRAQVAATEYAFT